MVEFRALAFVDRQGINGFMGRQTDWVEATQTTCCVPEIRAHLSATIWIGENQADITIKLAINAALIARLFYRP